MNTAGLEEKAKEGTDASLEILFEDFEIRSSAQELKRLLARVRRSEGVEIAHGTEEDPKIVEEGRKLLLDRMGRRNDQNIRNWLNDKNLVMSRESAIKICLALKVKNLYGAGKFIMRSCGDEAYDFYARDYKDIIYMFCLRYGLGIDEAKGLIDKYCKIIPIKIDENISELLSRILLDLARNAHINNAAVVVKAVIDKINWQTFYENEFQSGKKIIRDFCEKNEIDKDKKKEEKSKEEEACKKYMKLVNEKNNKIISTELLEKNFDKIKNKDELEKYLEDNIDTFGMFRRTAFKNFIKLYKEIKVFKRNKYKYEDKYEEALKPDNVFDSIIKIGGSENAEYLPTTEEIDSKPFPTKKEMASMPLTSILKMSILKIIINTAKLNSSTFEEIINQTDQVPRKYIIFLFLHLWNYEKDDDPKDEIDLLLEECGFPPLDPRNPFDYIVINSMYWEKNQTSKHPYEIDRFAIDKVKENVRKIFNTYYKAPH